jgi:hypothetical protein
VFLEEIVELRELVRVHEFHAVMSFTKYAEDVHESGGGHERVAIVASCTVRV